MSPMVKGIIIALSIIVPFAIVGIVILRSRDGSPRMRKLLRQSGGRVARAQIVAAKKGRWVTSTGASAAQEVASARVTWTLTVRVMPDDEPPFDATMKEKYSYGGRPQVNSVIDVLYDPKDHSKVVRDDSRAGSDAARMRAAERLRQLAPEQHGQAASPPFTVASAPASNPAPSVADEIGKLASLRDQGLLTSAEFEAQKTKLLGN